MNFRAAILSAVLLAALRAIAAEPLELVPGLTYLRLNAYEQDSAHLATALAANRPLIVDVRYPGEAGAEQFPLDALLAQRPASASATVFFLVSPETPPALAAALQRLPRGVITMGVEGSRPTPVVVVAQPAATDRRAHDAWSEKITLSSLITGKTEKERFDEAALVKEFRNGTGSTTTPPPAADPAAATKEDEKVPVLTDRVLQRAVHLHRAHLALKHRTP